MKKLLIALSAFAAASLCLASEKFDLWPEGKMPGKSAAEPESSKIEDTWIGKKVVVVCPGGGYGVIAYGHEGTEIAEWLNSHGVSALVLKYRVPNNPMGALMDAQRAIRTARANAKEWNVDPNKIAVMGFSAGASLSARASTNYEKKLYQPIDNIDGLSARPDGTILIYPAYCDEPGNEKRWKNSKNPGHDYNGMYRLAGELPVTKDTPPAFIVQTLDDGLVNSAISYFLALKELKVPASVHIFQSGGHGYALRKLDKPVDEWKDLLATWLKAYNY